MKKILLVEDDTSMRNFLFAALSDAGYEVQQASDGLEALDKLKATPFDLLLTDIVMPAMDGISLSKHAREISPNMKVIFITGFSGMASFSANEQDPVVTKPFHLKDLVTRVNVMLNNRPT